MACPNADTPAGLLAQTTAEAAVLCLINEARVAAGVAPLTLNLALRAAARQHANDAKTLKWWAAGADPHINPVTGSTSQDRIKDAGYCPKEATTPTAENVHQAWFRGANQTNTTPQAAVTAWMNSPGHRNNLLNATFSETGVAVVLGVAERGQGPDAADGGAIFVQTFGGCQVPRPATGEVWGWGRNDKGQIGDGTTTDRHTAVHVQALTGVAAIAAGGFHSLAIMSDSTVMAWGGNQKGQLGDGSNTDRHSPVQVADFRDVIAVSAGWEHSLALTADGSVWSWGANNFGQLGDGTTDPRNTRGPVGGLSGVVAISAGFEHSLALRADGSVWGWGSNINGQMGDNLFFDNKVMPVQVPLPNTAGPIVAIAAGGFHNLALEQNGQVWAWGGNSYGQLGDGTLTESWVPVRPVNLFEVTAIAAGFGHNLVLKRDGSVSAWGMNYYGGPVGDNTTVDRATPVPVMGLPGVLGIASSSSSFHSLAIAVPV